MLLSCILYKSLFDAVVPFPALSTSFLMEGAWLDKKKKKKVHLWDISRRFGVFTSLNVLQASNFVPLSCRGSICSKLEHIRLCGLSHNIFHVQSLAVGESQHFSTEVSQLCAVLGSCYTQSFLAQRGHLCLQHHTLQQEFGFLVSAWQGPTSGGTVF